MNCAPACVRCRASQPQSEQLGSRSNKFWLVSHPHDIEDGGVELLLESWGGEAVYFWQRDPDLQSLLKRTGLPRVIELAVPLAATNHAYSAGRAVVWTFARTLGCHADGGAFDLYTRHPLGAYAILKVHGEGEATFTGMARTYPTRFDHSVRPIDRRRSVKPDLGSESQLRK